MSDSRFRGPDAGPDDVSARFRAAWTSTADPVAASPELLPDRLARACTRVLGADGCGLSAIETDLRVPLGASDNDSLVAEQLQFTQGEGPCLGAARDGRVRACSAEQLQRLWPAYAGELFTRTPFRAVMTLPLVLDANLRGALDVFFTDRGGMDAVSMADASTIADRIVEALNASRIAGSTTGTGPTTDLPPWLANPKAERRLQVWIAMGMAMSRFRITASDALALLRAHSYSRNTTLDDLADDLVNGVVAIDHLTP